MRATKSIFAAALTTMVTLGVSTPAFAAASWKVVASPNSTTQDSFGAVALRSPINTIFGIAAASDTDIWAVGGASTGNQQDVTLTEHYDGTAWTVVASPDVNTADGLADVATNGAVAWAVGSTSAAGAATFQTLTELYS